MIIKKPYAFLIKHFRIIHLLLSVALIYIAYKTSVIYNFFNDYVKEGFYTFYSNLGIEFINYYMFLIIIFIVLIGIILYFLLKWKNKKTFFYTILCLFYLVLFVVYIYMFNIFQSLQISIIDERIIRASRDIALMVTIPQYLFVAFTIFRGIGFDIKKFNFNKDLAELNINIKDNEEIELILAKDTYKYLRGIRRFLRELKYFALENRFIFIVISSIIIVWISLSIYLNVEVYNKTYLETENFIADGLNISVDESYISSNDYKGQIINKDKFYVIIKLKIANNGTEEVKINTDNYRLLLNEKIYYPNLSKENYFLDLGDSYSNEKFLPGENYNYLFIYEINKKDINNNFIFRIVNDVKLLEGNIEADYKDVYIKPKNLNEILNIGEYNINEEIKLDKSNLLTSTIKINSYLISDSFSEKYRYCLNEKECYEGEKIIKPLIEENNDKLLMKIDTNVLIDNTLFISKHLKSGKDLIKYFGSINYTINGNEKNIDSKIINSIYIKNNIAFLEIPKEIINATNIKLFLTIRNVRYIVILK